MTCTHGYHANTAVLSVHVCFFHMLNTLTQALVLLYIKNHLDTLDNRDTEDKVVIRCSIVEPLEAKCSSQIVLLHYSMEADAKICVECFAQRT